MILDDHERRRWAASPGATKPLHKIYDAKSRELVGLAYDAADAELMALAPELLDALQDAVDHLWGDWTAAMREDAMQNHPDWLVVRLATVLRKAPLQ